MTLSNPLVRKDTTSDQTADWYSGVTHAPAPVLASQPPVQNNPLSPFGYSQTTPSQQPPPTSWDFTFTPPASQDEAIYDTPSSFMYPPPSTGTTNTQSTTVVQPPTADLMSLNSPITPAASKSNVENTTTSTSSKPKSGKSWFGTLGRQKSKAEADKRRLSAEDPSEVINFSFQLVVAID